MKRSVGTRPGPPRVKAARAWRLLPLGVLALLASPASGDSLRPGIIGTDDRVILAEEGPPWDAIGHVNIGGFRTSGQCTGTLIATDLVVTAAHCVVDPAGLAFPAKNVHFLAAVRRDLNKGHSTARCLRFIDGNAWTEAGGAPGSANGKVSLSALASDAAVIVLSEPLDVEPAPLAANMTPAPGTALTHVAYPGDRRFLPVVHRNCQLERADPGSGLWFTDCDTHPGSSGGPVFVEEDGIYGLAAILIGAGGGERANVALSQAAWGDLVQEAICP
jgi:protease YdgD